MGAVASIGGALIGASASKKAAKAQTAAANRDIAFQKETRDLIRSDLAPYRTGGYTAQQALDYELGLGAKPMIGGTPAAIETFSMGSPAGGGSVPNINSFINGLAGIPQGQGIGGTGGGTGYRVNGQVFKTLKEAQDFANANPTGGTEYGGYTKTPGYDFRMSQGQDSIEASAAARGGLYSGAAMRDALTFGQDYATSEYGNYLSRLGARADTGLSAATQSGVASQAAAGNIGNALGNIGNAQSAGAIGQANAWTGGMQNLAGLWNYQRNINPGAGGGVTVGSNLFGGNSWG